MNPPFALLCSLIWLALARGSTSPEDYRVGDAAALEGTAAFAGLLKLDETPQSVDVTPNTSHFFWFWPTAANESDALGERPLVVWFNGGPGCSSLVGMLFENGPFALDCDANGGFVRTANPHSWHHEANVLYLEQPAGVGFAGGDAGRVHDEAQVARDVFASLSRFVESFDEYR